MSATGLEVFDKTLQTTNIWLNEIMDRLGPDRQLAWKALSVVLHKLRDRLPLELSAHLGAQLPLLVRGIYYDQFEPGRIPADCRSPEEFTEEVAEWLSDMAKYMRMLLNRGALPKGIRMLWDGADARFLAEAGA